VTLDDDIQNRSNHVWVIFLDRPTSDNFDDNKTVDTNPETEDDLGNMLSP